MKFKHTPGPWKVYNPTCYDLAVHYQNRELHNWPTDYTPQDLADAYLIAAAPDLLAACKALLRLHYDTGKASLNALQVSNQADDAISKATRHLINKSKET